MRRWVVIAAAMPLFAAGAAETGAAPRVVLDPVVSPAIAVAGAQRELVVPVEADATLDAAAPGVPMGGGTALRVTSAPSRDALLRFDLDVGVTSTRRVLRLHLNPATPAAATVGTAVDVQIAWLSDVAWREATVTAATAPGIDGAFHLVRGTVGAHGWLELDLTGVVGGGRATLQVRSAGADLVADARESGDGPQMVLRVGASADREAVRLWAVGDLACRGADAVTADACHQWAVSNLVAADPTADVFVALGDLQYPGGALADYLTGYAPSYGRLLAITLPAPGNHDWSTPSAAGYRSYFGARAHPETSGWYSVDLGATWHVVVLDSDCTQVGCGTGSAQEAWLRADLAASSRPCTIGVWHHPRFSSGRHYGVDEEVRPLWQALADDGAEIVLNGHDHVYERFHRQTVDGVNDASGLRQFTVGTGGRSLYEFGMPLASSAVRLSTFGALRLDLTASGYTWAFVDEHGTVLDSGTGVCT